jgi:3-carboxy-cis,cis-muconate cycloisomerase
MSLYSKLFYSDDVNALFSDSRTIAQMIRVEVALVNAQANKGLFSKAISATIAKHCNGIKIDVEGLKTAITLG